MLDDLSLAIIATLVPFSALCYAYLLDMQRIRRYQQESGLLESSDPMVLPSEMTPVP